MATSSTSPSVGRGPSGGKRPNRYPYSGSVQSSPRRSLRFRRVGTRRTSQCRECAVEVADEVRGELGSIDRPQDGDHRRPFRRFAPDPLEHADREGRQLGIPEPIGHRLDRALADRCDGVAQVDPIGAVGLARLGQKVVEIAHAPCLLRGASLPAVAAAESSAIRRGSLVGNARVITR